MLAALLPILLIKSPLITTLWTGRVPATAPEPSAAGMKPAAADPTALIAPLSEPRLEKTPLDLPMELSAPFEADVAPKKLGKRKLAASEFKEPDAAPPSPRFPGIKEPGAALT